MRNGIFDGSHGVIFPIDFPAFEVTAASKSGTSVKITIRNPFLCKMSRTLSRRNSKNAAMQLNMATSGIKVLLDKKISPIESFAGRGVSFDKSTGEGGVAGKPIICFFSGE